MRKLTLTEWYCLCKGMHPDNGEVVKATDIIAARKTFAKKWGLKLCDVEATLYRRIQ